MQVASAASRNKVVIWTIAGIVAAAGAGALAIKMHQWRQRSITIHGAVIRRDTDTRKQLPIADAEVTASDGVTSVSTRSDATGYFKLAYSRILWPGKTVYLSFRHPDYKPLDLKLQAGLHVTTRILYVEALEPVAQADQSEEEASRASVVSNVRIRYTVNAQSEMNIATAVRTFEVVNKGNVPCNNRLPCSPDGSWKAARGSLTVDAGSGNQFRNARVSCIAGPCPFTRIDSTGFAQGGPSITASALDWSDTATFLLEADVFHTANKSDLRESFPVQFGRALSFSVPPTQEGVSIEAEIDGAPMVFPLGPDLYLSWATCTAVTDTEADKSTVYRCEPKPGYRF